MAGKRKPKKTNQCTKRLQIILAVFKISKIDLKYVNKHKISRNKIPFSNAKHHVQTDKTVVLTVTSHNTTIAMY